MVIEILYPEVGRLFGDSGNVLYLRQTLPFADFIETHMDDEPYFATQVPDLIYMGPATEQNQKMLIQRLYPYKDRLMELMETDVSMLFTGNAGEIFFEKILSWDGTETKGLGIFPLIVKRSRYDRYNGLCLGTFQDQFDVVGFRSQFDFWEGDNEKMPFLKVKRGIGIHKESMLEGIYYHRTMITGLLGPILVNNPKLTRFVLDQIGAAEVPLAYEQALQEAFDRRIKEFNDPGVKFAI